MRISTTPAAPRSAGVTNGASGVTPGADGMNGVTNGMSAEVLRALYVHDVAELYAAENLLLDSLPRWADRCDDADLRFAFESQGELTRRHAGRLEKLLGSIGFRPRGLRCRDMERLLAKAADVLTIPNRGARDRLLVEAARRIERWQIASYHAAARIAELLGEPDACAQLRCTLNEEAETSYILDDLARRRLAPNGGGASIAQGEPVH